MSFFPEVPKSAAWSAPHRFSLALLCLAGCVALYALVGELVQAPVRPWETPVDALIPFTPAAIWVYVTFYPASFTITVLALRESRMLKGALVAFPVVQALACLVFVLVPTASPRPQLEEPLSGSLALVGLLYRIDTPHNAFPSMHVANTTLCALLVITADRSKKLLAGFLLMGTWVAILSLKQHWLVDGVAGTVLGMIGFELWKRCVRLRRTAPARSEHVERGGDALPPSRARERWSGQI
jgi:membrane-associated phospholipid phosphatase